MNQPVSQSISQSKETKQKTMPVTKNNVSGRGNYQWYVITTNWLWILKGTKSNGIVSNIVKMWIFRVDLAQRSPKQSISERHWNLSDLYRLQFSGFLRWSAGIYAAQNMTLATREFAHPGSNLGSQIRLKTMKMTMNCRVMLIVLLCARSLRQERSLFKIASLPLPSKANTAFPLIFPPYFRTAGV